MGKHDRTQKEKKQKNFENSICEFRNDYDFLSNFYPCQIEYEELFYQNAECAFQAQKCITQEEKLVFCNLPASKAKRMGRQVKLRPDWETVKVSIMEEIVRAKFVQNPYLMKKLLNTGELLLIEGNTWKDTFWGVDISSGKGENHLGKILMNVREELRKE